MYQPGTPARDTKRKETKRFLFQVRMTRESSGPFGSAEQQDVEWTESKDDRAFSMRIQITLNHAEDEEAERTARTAALRQL